MALKFNRGTRSVSISLWIGAAVLVVISAWAVGIGIFTNEIPEPPTLQIPVEFVFSSIDEAAIGNVSGPVAYQVVPEELDSDVLRISWAVATAATYLGLAVVLVLLARVLGSRESPFSETNRDRVTEGGFAGALLCFVGLFVREVLLEGRIANYLDLDTAPNSALISPPLLFLWILGGVGWVWARGSELHDFVDEVV